MFHKIFKLYVILLILISPLFLSGCGDSSDEPKVESLASIHTLNKIPEANLKYTNCDNVQNVQYNASQQVVFSWAENKDGKWNSFQLGTSYCENNKNFKKLGMCFNEKQSTAATKTVKVEDGHFVVSTVFDGYKTCTYKSKINAVIGTVTDGEIWSEGTCRHPQERASRKFLLCEKE